MDVAPGAPSFSVFHSVVAAAFDAGVDLIGTAVVGPFDGVVDFAQFGGQATAEVVALDGEELGGLSGGAGEHPDFAAEVDREVVGAEHDAADVPGECCAQDGVRVEDLAGGGFAAA